MADTRPKRPTRYKVDHGETHFGFDPLGPDIMLASEVDAWNTYRDGLLRQVLPELEKLAFYVGGRTAVRAIELRDEIRTALEEDV